MQARFVAVQFQPDKLEEAAGIMREVATALRQYTGFHEASLLADPNTGQGYIMTLWQTEEDMQASETSV
jgi:heme-degrading monooxygenase HmoA